MAHELKGLDGVQQALWSTTSTLMELAYKLSAGGGPEDFVKARAQLVTGFSDQVPLWRKKAFFSEEASYEARQLLHSV